MKRILYAFIGFALIGCSSAEHTSKINYEVIPLPQSIKYTEAAPFTLDASVVITYPTGDTTLVQNAAFLADYIKELTGITLAVKPNATGKVIRLESSLPSENKEAYQLHIHKEQITLKGASPAGVFYGIQTLRKCLPVEQQTHYELPAAVIDDAPRFGYRGTHLDVSRHFFSADFIKRYIDILALHNINTFHWHLTDDQGWRIEIKKYPKLTEVGAWRVDQEDKLWDERVPNDADAIAKGAKKYGGYYSQEDIDEMVRYASSRGITIVPEIEMPAHVMSAIAAYPELSCHKRPIGVPSGAVWPITDIYCAGQEETFEFIEGVLTEVMELFPSKYIHIGGDEATHTEWERCPKCKQRMKEYHLKDVHQLQRYFINRVNDFLVSKGRTLVGWDEIVEEGLAKDAVVMNWRGIEVGKQALAQGNKLVLTSDCYINHYQGLPDYEPLANGGYLPLKQLYHYN